MCLQYKKVHLSNFLFFFSVEFYTPIFQILKSLDTQNIKKEIYTFQISTIES